MTEYPSGWIIGKTYDPKNGQMLPLYLPPNENESCPNCGQTPPGIILGFQVGEGQARQYLKDGKFILGKTIIAPCPVCGGSQEEYLWKVSGLCGRSLDGKMANMITILDFQEKPGNSEALAALNKFVSGATAGGDLIPWYYLSGTNGTGKTHLMWSGINMLIKADTQAHYSTLKNILDDIKETYDLQSTERTVSVRRKYININTLFIDEFDKDGWSDWAANEVFEILNERGMQRKPTMICSNKSPEELDFDKFKAMISRISTGLIVKISGPDMRPALGGHYMDDH
jgi:DNA replication protein DnaC